MTDEQYRILLMYLKQLDSQNQTIIRLLSNKTESDSRLRSRIKSLRENIIQMRAKNLLLQLQNKELTDALAYKP